MNLIDIFHFSDSEIFRNLIHFDTNYTAIYWADMQFGALMDALQRYGVYDDTYVIFQSDHGQEAKGKLTDLIYLTFSKFSNMLSGNVMKLNNLSQNIL